MKTKLFLSFFFTVFLSMSSISTIYAIEDPLTLPNNKVGIHILFSSEVADASKLVNSNGGDWGYVTIPIQAGDKDLVKWQQFMDDARKFHVIPILRLATENYYFDTTVWRKPTYEDIIDFANFLNSLQWPTKNRYVIIYNEVNRSDEWSESPDPEFYAQLLQYAVTVFKSKSQDFFILPAGLDNAAANVTGVTMDQYDYIRGMQKAVPGIFNQVDGIASHSYPNPGFAQPPTSLTNQSIASFQHEKKLIQSFTNKDLPIFITETGWSKDAVSQSSGASYFKTAFEQIWSDKNIVAVTPFLFRADAGPFATFSFFSNGQKNAYYTSVEELSKVKGAPTLTEEILGNTTSDTQDLPVKNFPTDQDSSLDMEESLVLSEPVKMFTKMLLQIRP